MFWRSVIVKIDALVLSVFFFKRIYFQKELIVTRRGLLRKLNPWSSGKKAHANPTGREDEEYKSS